MLSLPPPIEAEIFRGYTLEDVERIVALQGPSAPFSGGKGLVDWFGVKIGAEYTRWIEARAGEVIDHPPFPDDGFLAEGIEYAALGLALTHAAGQATFTAIELGAGWGPWTVLAAVCARRLGFQAVSLGAMEADAARFSQLRDHLALNELVPRDLDNQGKVGAIAFDLEQAAVWWEDTTLFWPEAGEGDAGRAVVVGAEEQLDYRGLNLPTRPIPAIGLDGFLNRFELVDFLHVDIQGAEAEIIPKSLEALEKKVRIMFVGTHSRKIEGDLLECLYDRGWRLLREQPCRFNPDLRSPTFLGLTQRDGGLVFLAPRFAQR